MRVDVTSQGRNWTRVCRSRRGPTEQCGRGPTEQWEVDDRRAGHQRYREIQKHRRLLEVRLFDSLVWEAKMSRQLGDRFTVTLEVILINSLVQRA